MLSIVIYAVPVPRTVIYSRAGAKDCYLWCHLSSLGPHPGSRAGMAEREPTPAATIDEEQKAATAAERPERRQRGSNSFGKGVIRVPQRGGKPDRFGARAGPSQRSSWHIRYARRSRNCGCGGGGQAGCRKFTLG